MRLPVPLLDTCALKLSLTPGMFFVSHSNVQNYSALLRSRFRAQGVTIFYCVARGITESDSCSDGEREPAKNLSFEQYRIVVESFAAKDLPLHISATIFAAKEIGEKLYVP